MSSPGSEGVSVGLAGLFAVWTIMGCVAPAQEVPGGARGDDRADQAPEAGAGATAPVRRSEDLVVESASKHETGVIDAPATISVVTSDALATAAAANHADLLRSIPGMNAIQTSARDLNLTTRQATSTLNNSQLVLVDGRSVYLDFFGLVLWDFVPRPGSEEIRQIEVVRGPASVVWGANALTGVVNVVTRSPREAPGLGATLAAGRFGRAGGSRAGEGAGHQYEGSLSYSGSAGTRWAYRLGASYLASDPHSRPVGTVPLGCHPLGVTPCRGADGRALPWGFPVGGGAYPAETRGPGGFVNSGTRQPRFDLRLDRETKQGRITWQGGYAGTAGIIHTGIGPFDIQRGSSLAYGRVAYRRGALRLSSFGNFVDVSAPNLLQTDPLTGAPVVLDFDSGTFDVEAGHSRVVRGRHLLSYGGNLRHNAFDVTLAPGAEDRAEVGVYVQDEFFVSRFRLTAGVRMDRFAHLDHWVHSPRLSAMWKPAGDQSIRLSFNRAFRAPSVVNTHLEQTVFSPSATDLRPLAAALPALGPLLPREPFFLVLETFGNPNLREESVQALELAWTGRIGPRTTAGLAVYQADTDDNTNFTYLLPTPENPEGLPGLEFYSATRPARAVGAVSGSPITFSPQIMTALAALPPPFGPVILPQRVATYLNLGPLRNRGVEISIEHRVSDRLRAFANYSRQARPSVLEPGPRQIRFPLNEVGVAPASRLNAGLSWNGERAFSSLSLAHASRGFWNDVLNEPYFGYTRAYTLLDGAAGVRLMSDRVALSLRGTNLLDQEVQQHVYGDLLRRSLRVEVRLRQR